MRARAQSISSSEADQAINNASKIRSKKNKHGNKGEQLVLKKLRSSTDYKKVSHASLRNNRLGYDIKTTDKKGNEQFHEVKSSSKKKFSPSTWHIASNQLNKAKNNLKKYFFWFVNALNTQKPIIKKLSPDQMDFNPSRFQVTVNETYPVKENISLEASSLVDVLENRSKSLGAQSARATKTVSEDRQLIAQAVLTRQFLAKNLNKNNFSDIDCNCDQGNSRKPYHIRYTDKDGKLVYVDIKVQLVENISSPNRNSFRLHVTKNRRDQAMKLKPDSDHRREFWYCVLDKASKKLFVYVYDVSGKEFWKNNETQIDYYSFKEK